MTCQDVSTKAEPVRGFRTGFRKLFFLTECKDHRETEVQLQAIPFLGKRVFKLFSFVHCKRCATLEAELEFP